MQDPSDRAARLLLQVLVGGIVLVFVGVVAAIIAWKVMDPRAGFVEDVADRVAAGSAGPPASLSCLQARALGEADGGPGLTAEALRACLGAPRRGASHWPGDGSPIVGWGRLRRSVAPLLTALAAPESGADPVSDPEASLALCLDLVAFAVDLGRAGTSAASVSGARLLDDLAPACASALELAPDDVAVETRLLLRASLAALPTPEDVLDDAELVRQLGRYGHALSREQRLALPDAARALTRDPDLVDCVPCLPVTATDLFDWAAARRGQRDAVPGDLPERSVARLRAGRAALSALAAPP